MSNPKRVGPRGRDLSTGQQVEADALMTDNRYWNVRVRIDGGAWWIVGTAMGHASAMRQIETALQTASVIIHRLAAPAKPSVGCTTYDRPVA